MKRILLMGVLSFFCWLPVSAQDLIVTTANDSIHCYITGEDSANVYLTMKYKLKSSRIDTYIARENISVMAKGYYPREKFKWFRNDYSKYRIAVNAGYDVRMFAPTHSPQLKEGFAFDGDAHWFFERSFGVGLHFHTAMYDCNQNIKAAVWGKDGIYYFPGMLDADVSTYYIGPSCLFRVFLSRSRSALLVGMSANYTYMKYSGLWKEKGFCEKGSGFGGQFSLGYDFSLTRRSALGVALSIMIAKIGRPNVWRETGYYGNVVVNKNISYFNFSVGYRFGN